MDRAEVVAALREAYETGGMGLLSAIADDIREHGQLHDPEFSTCSDCGVDFENEPSAQLNGCTQPKRCPGCRQAALEAMWKRNRQRAKERNP